MHERQALSSPDSAFSSVKWVQGEIGVPMQLLRRVHNVRLLEGGGLINWDGGAGHPGWVPPALLPPSQTPSVSPPVAQGLRGFRPWGQEATSKARLAVLIGEHVTAHKAGGASIPRARNLV